MDVLIGAQKYILQFVHPGMVPLGEGSIPAGWPGTDVLLLAVPQGAQCWRMHSPDALHGLFELPLAYVTSQEDGGSGRL